MKNLKILWNRDSEMHTLLPLFFKKETSAINLFFIYQNYYNDDKEKTSLSGLELALEISANHENLVIFCSSCDRWFFVSHTEKSTSFQFMELVRRENVAFLLTPISKKDALGAYYGLLKSRCE